jgi:amino acid permease
MLPVHGNANDQDEVPYDAHFPFWVTVAFTLNYIIGSGFLTLPWAFEKAGILLGVIILFLFGFFSTISVFFILETMARAEKLDQFHGLHMKGSSIELQELTNDSIPSESQHSLVIPEAERSEIAQPHLAYIRRKKEMTELCQLFLGDAGKYLYLGTICTYMYGTLWAYSTVFANSFSAAGDYYMSKTSTYYVFLFIFSCLVIPVSLLEFSEQLYLQVSLAVFRVIMVFAMVFSIVCAYLSPEENQFDLPQDYTDHHNTTIFFECQFSNLYLLMPITAFAFLFHHSVPSLAEPVTSKRQLNSLFQTSLIITLVFYVALGVIISAYFGESTLSSSNLNWKSYKHHSWFSSMVRFFILLFPAVDVASAFPLNAFTLGNNLMTAYYGKDIHLYDANRSKTHLFRAIGAIPPILGAVFVSDLGQITSWTGLTGFGLVFIFPPLLSYVAKKKLDVIGVESQTIHSSFWTNKFWQFVLFSSGVLFFLYNGYILTITDG